MRDVGIRTMMSREQRQMLLQWRREARHCTESIAENQPLEIPSVDDPFVVSKVIIICMGSVW